MTSFLTLFAQLKWKDIADILIVAFLVYQVLLIVRGTKAVQMLWGLAFLFGLFWIGLTFKLYSLNWVLAHFVDSFFIIAVILFQDQFRVALASVVTKGKLLDLFKRQDIDTEVDEVVEACHALSKEKIGALIVFERGHGLLNYIMTGTKMDCKLHSDIVYAIFESSSSLHDGAMIIQNGKIAAAGCFLPLSKNFDIERHLGTRHRAALGLSELTDAIIVVVSEESGKINICVEGVFYPCKTDKELGIYLRQLMANEKMTLQTQRN